MSCHRLRIGHPAKHGFISSPVPDPPLLAVTPNPVGTLVDSTDIIYASSSPSTFENLSKGQLMFIEDMEAVALHSHSGHVGILEDSTVLEPLSSSERIVVDGTPPFTLEHYPSLPLSSSSPSLSSTPPLSPSGITVPIPIVSSSSPPEALAF